MNILLSCSVLVPAHFKSCDVNKETEKIYTERAVKRRDL